jgi:hypothetical protein
LSGTVGSLSSTVSSYGSAISGLQAKYGVRLDVNGYVTGFEQNNSGSSGNFTVKADTFSVIMPGYAGITPFTVDSGGVRINGNLVVDGTITGTKIVSGGIDTAQLADNSVTVPTILKSATTKVGNGGYQTIVSGSITLDAAGTVFIMFTGTQSYLSGLRSWALNLKINGSVVSSVGGAGGFTDSVSCSGAAALAAGTYPIVVEWYGSDSTLSLSNDTTYIQGVLK